MNTYTILCCIIIAAAFLFSGYYNLKKDYFIKISFIAMFIVYAFRDAKKIGIDSSTSYLANFNEIAGNNVSINTRNVLFQLLTKWMHNVTKGNYQIYIIIIAVFVTLSYYHLVRKYSVNPMISIMWFIGMLYYIFMFSALKQSIAMAILVWAFDAMMENRRIRFYILVLIAAGFHIPALIFLPVFLLSRIQFGRNYLIVLGLVMLFVFLFRERILKLMTSFYESGETMNMENTQFLGNKVIIMLLIILFALLMRNIDREDRLYNILLIMMGIAAVLQTFCYYNNIFERLADYYYQFSVLFMPMLFVKSNQNRSAFSLETVQLVYFLGPLVIIGFSIWRFLYYINGYAEYFLPFKFFWS